MSDQTDHDRRRFLGAAAVGVAASLTKLLFADTANAGEHMMDAFHSARMPASAPRSDESLLRDEGRMPELTGAVG